MKLLITGTGTTVTVVAAVVVPPALVAVSVYVVVVVGETVTGELTCPLTPERVTDVAP